MYAYCDNDDERVSKEGFDMAPSTSVYHDGIREKVYCSHQETLDISFPASVGTDVPIGLSRSLVSMIHLYSFRSKEVPILIPSASCGRESSRPHHQSNPTKNKQLSGGDRAPGRPLSASSIIDADMVDSIALRSMCRIYHTYALLHQPARAAHACRR
jgi:hypothetical protein